MNNNQLAEVAKILGVSEDSISAMNDEIKNSMTAAARNKSRILSQKQSPATMKHCSVNCKHTENLTVTISFWAKSQNY